MSGMAEGTPPIKDVPPNDMDDDDDDLGPGGSGRRATPRERRKIEIKFIQDKARRHITFSKRKHGIMKKAWELSVLTGTQVLLLVVSETGLVYTFTTPKLQPLVTQSEGKNLIQSCLNAPESPGPDAGPAAPTATSPSPAASASTKTAPPDSQPPVHDTPAVARGGMPIDPATLMGTPLQGPYLGPEYPQYMPVGQQPPHGYN